LNCPQVKAVGGELAAIGSWTALISLASAAGYVTALWLNSAVLARERAQRPRGCRVSTGFSGSRVRHSEPATEVVCELAANRVIDHGASFQMADTAKPARSARNVPITR
jgi:hypothetical protein